jgi:hypothetical protein
MMFCGDPTPITGNTRRVVPSLVALASSSAMRTDIPALPSVSSITTPGLLPTAERSVAAREGVVGA